MTNTCLITAVKNEGPDLLEWVAYHRLIGFTSILAYSNDCTDGSDHLLDALQQFGWLTHLRHAPNSGQSAQGAAAGLAFKHPDVASANWVLWLDADEFLNVHCGSGRLQDLIDALQDADGIAINWRNFGDSGYDTTNEMLVIDRFTRAGKAKLRQSRTVKSLFRMTDRIEALEIHRPLWRRNPLTPVRLVGGDLRAMPEDFVFNPKRNGRPADMVDKGGQTYTLAQINHYAVKALDRVALKKARGNGLLPGAPGGRFGFGYLRRFNHNDEEDRTIQRHLPALRDYMAEALADPRVAEAYYACQRQFARLLGQLDEVTAALREDRTGAANAEGDDTDA